MGKPQRIRDPVHDLIEFEGEGLDQICWAIVDTAEFQRLRRIKQLGFSELVFPGATHTRFAHSVGVFHNARRLAALLHRRLGDRFDHGRSQVAIAAALVHDLGHGPFSHAFEDAMEKLGLAKRHEDWTAEIVSGDTEVQAILHRFSPSLSNDAGVLLANETPADIYSAIVSSQFDADRLDYVRRDRLMTGAQHGGFDFSWLMANLEVDNVAISKDGEDFGEVECLILGKKAFQAAESFVLGLFHLYFTVYFHKATRSAEKMLSATLVRMGHLVSAGDIQRTGLSDSHPVVSFVRTPSLANYLRLDDFVVWASLHEMARATDGTLAGLASRIIGRRLYKGIDVTDRFSARGGESAVARFRAKLNDARENGRFEEFEILEDRATRNPYKRRGYDSPEALEKVLIRRSDGTGYEDISERSKVVSALQQQSLYRVYARDEPAMKKLEAIVGEVQ